MICIVKITQFCQNKLKICKDKGLTNDQTKFAKSFLALTRMIKETSMIRRKLIDLLSLEVKTLYILEKNYQMSFL
jgi:hypothetical protein